MAPTPFSLTRGVVMVLVATLVLVGVAFVVDSHGTGGGGGGGGGSESEVFRSRNTGSPESRSVSTLGASASAPFLPPTRTTITPSRPLPPAASLVADSPPPSAVDVDSYGSIPVVPAHCSAMPPATFWTSDLHDGTRADLMSTLSSLGYTVYNGGHKRTYGPYPDVWSMPRVKFPARYAPAIEKHVSQKLYMTEADVKSTLDFYQGDADMTATDAFVCAFPATYCELWLPLNRSIIWLAAHRYSLGRCPLDQWNRLTRHMQITAAHPERGNVVAAMSVYDAEYINYFTGIVPTVIFSAAFWYIGHNITTYNPTARPEILVGPLQRDHVPRNDEMDEVAAGKYTFVPVKKLYKRFVPQDIANHRAVVMFPYAVMSYGITEVYAMGVPMFVPSVRFLRECGIVDDRRLRDHYYCGEDAPVPPKHPDSRHPFSPEDNDVESFTYWLQFADYYILPHIQTFDSFENLVALLDATDFQAVHSKMMEENARREARVTAQWQTIACNAPRGNAIPKDYNVAVRELLDGAAQLE